LEISISQRAQYAATPARLISDGDWRDSYSAIKPRKPVQHAITFLSGGVFYNRTENAKQKIKFAYHYLCGRLPSWCHTFLVVWEELAQS